jgi:hypothetical protein
VQQCVNQESFSLGRIHPVQPKNTEHGAELLPNMMDFLSKNASFFKSVDDNGIYTALG